MSQCIQIVEHMTDAPPRPKRPAAGSSGQYNQTQQLEHTSGDVISPRLHNPSSSSTLIPIAILPRPSRAHDQSCASALLPGDNERRKRGRPSRADKAKRNLYPNLPPHLAPRSLPGTGYRPILPAVPSQNGNSMQPSGQTLPPILSEPPEVEREKKRRRLDNAVHMQQAGPDSIKANTAPAVSNDAI